MSDTKHDDWPISLVPHDATARAASGICKLQSYKKDLQEASKCRFLKVKKKKSSEGAVKSPEGPRLIFITCHNVTFL